MGFMILDEKNSRNQFLMNWVKTGQILKIGEETRIKGFNLWIILKKIHGWCQFLKILVSFNGFGSFLKKGSKKKEFGHLEEFSDFGRFDLLSLIGLYRNVEGQIWRSRLHENCRWLKIIEFHIRIGPKISPNTLSKLRPICWSEL